MRDAVRDTVTVIPVDSTKCKHYGSHSVIRDCIRKFKKGNVQQYKCKDCYRWLTHNLCFERRRATPEQVSTAVELLFAGMSSRKTVKAMQGMGVKVSYMTVQRWVAAYAVIMERFADTILPRVDE